MAEAKQKRQKRSVYLIVEKPQEFTTKKQAEAYLSENPEKLTPDTLVYQAKRVGCRTQKTIHLG